jgi:hypothetical protein
MKIEDIHKYFVTGRFAFWGAIIVFIALRLPGSGNGFTLSWWISLIVQLGIALLLLQLIHSFAIIRHRSLLPAFFYLLFTGTNSTFFYDPVGSISSLLIVFCFFFLFDSYNNTQSQQNAFNISVLLTVGSLYWAPMLFLFLLFWAGMLQFRSLNLKTFIASFLGFVIVYLFLFTWSVYKDDWSIFLNYINRYKAIVDTQYWGVRSVHPTEWIRGGFIVILFFLSMWRILVSGISEKVRVRTFLDYLFIFPLIIFILVFFQNEGKKEWILISFVPVSLLIAHFFTFTFKNWASWLFLFTILFFLVLYG